MVVVKTFHLSSGARARSFSDSHYSSSPHSRGSNDTACIPNDKGEHVTGPGQSE